MKVPIPQKISILINSITTKDTFSNIELKSLLKALKINFYDLLPFVRFNHPVEESYGRYVLYNSPKLEIVVMSWNKNDYTSIHDHGYAQWGAVQCFGKIEHSSFLFENDKLRIIEKRKFEGGNISMVTNQLIHQMGNPFNQPAVSLHVYGTNTKVNEVTGSAKNYFPVKRKVISASGGAFLEIPANKIEKEEKGLKVDSNVYANSLKIFANYKRKEREAFSYRINWKTSVYHSYEWMY